MNWFPLLVLKRKVEVALQFPFILLGYWLARRNPLPEEYDLFCFFSRYPLGGAERVHADIVGAFPDKKIAVFFSKRSQDDGMLAAFRKPWAMLRDISPATHFSQGIRNFIWRGRCAYYINHQRTKQPVVFVGQCNFGYKILPFVKPGIRVVELMHNDHYGNAKITLPYIPMIDVRVMLAEKIADAHRGYYRRFGIPERYGERIRIVSNKVDFFTDSLPEKAEHGAMKVIYTGRGGPLKRLSLLFRIASQCLDRGMPVNFHFAGPFEEEIPVTLRPLVTYHGSITAVEAMHALLEPMDVYLMTSALEGFPMAMMEAMANGVVPITTAVGGIPDHIHTGENGILLPTEDDEAIIAQGVEAIAALAGDPARRKAMSTAAYAYARAHFSAQTFRQGYATAFGFDCDLSSSTATSST